MLAKPHRIRTGGEFRRTLRRGRRSSGEYMLVVVNKNAGAPTRFGFIVAKSVGNAVTRNRVRRRLRAIAYEVIPTMSLGFDVVVRAFPASAGATWDSLRSELIRLLTRGTS